MAKVAFTPKAETALKASGIVSPVTQTVIAAPVNKPRGIARYCATVTDIKVPAGSYVIVLPSTPVRLSSGGNYTLAADSQVVTDGVNELVMPGSQSPIKFTASIWSKKVLGYALPNEAELAKERQMKDQIAAERAARKAAR